MDDGLDDLADLHLSGFDRLIAATNSIQAPALGGFHHEYRCTERPQRRRA